MPILDGVAVSHSHSQPVGSHWPSDSLLRRAVRAGILKQYYESSEAAIQNKDAAHAKQA